MRTPFDAAAASTPPTKMTTREVVVAMSGLLLGMFVAILAGTVVTTALPRIIADLTGGQAAYTWVVTSSLLATTVSTPIWGKLADLLNRKLLIQLSLAIFTVGSALCGLAPSTGALIGFRVLQGVGTGGLMALVQIIMADIVSPRERGKYMGLIGAVVAFGTVGGPLMGGLITDLVSWRWVFYLAIPVALGAIVVLQKTLQVPPRHPGKVRIDYLGTTLLATGTSLLLIWVTLVGTQFAWASATTAWMVGVAVVLLIALIVVELKVAEPIIPLGMFRSPTFTLAVLASIVMGVGMLGTTVYLTQYMQLARSASATMSGIMTAPLILGMMVASTAAGAMISRHGKWKGYLVTGGVLLTSGMVLLGTIEHDTNFWLVSAYMILQGAGIGMVMQNIVLVVQNEVDPRQIGVASSGLAFFRTLAGTIGVSALGGVLANRVASLLAEQKAAFAALAQSPDPAIASALQNLNEGNLPDMTTLPPELVQLIEPVFGSGVASLFWVVAPLGLLGIIVLALLPNQPLGRLTTGEKIASEDAATAAAATGLLDGRSDGRSDEQ